MDERTAPQMYDATVPVFLRLLDRLEAMLAKSGVSLGSGLPTALGTRPVDGMFPASQQIATAIQFMLRIAFPLAGLRVPELRAAFDADGLLTRIVAARNQLKSLPSEAFVGAEDRTIRAHAGFAELEMTGSAFLLEFGLPNIYFHQAMAYLVLKRAGVPLGKADFDGLHSYPEGFAFG